MAIDLNLRGKEKEQLKALIKVQKPNKLVNPKQDSKLKEASGEYLSIRGQQYK